MGCATCIVPEYTRSNCAERICTVLHYVMRCNTMRIQAHTYVTLLATVYTWYTEGGGGAVSVAAPIRRREARAGYSSAERSTLLGNVIRGLEGVLAEVY